MYNPIENPQQGDPLNKDHEERNQFTHELDLIPDDMRDDEEFVNQNDPRKKSPFRTEQADTNAFKPEDLDQEADQEPSEEEYLDRPDDKEDPLKESEIVIDGRPIEDFSLEELNLIAKIDQQDAQAITSLLHDPNEHLESLEDKLKNQATHKKYSERPLTSPEYLKKIIKNKQRELAEYTSNMYGEPVEVVYQREINYKNTGESAYDKELINGVREIQALREILQRKEHRENSNSTKKKRRPNRSLLRKILGKENPEDQGKITKTG